MDKKKTNAQKKGPRKFIPVSRKNASKSGSLSDILPSRGELRFSVFFTKLGYASLLCQLARKAIPGFGDICPGDLFGTRATVQSGRGWHHREISPITLPQILTISSTQTPMTVAAHYCNIGPKETFFEIKKAVEIILDKSRVSENKEDRLLRSRCQAMIKIFNDIIYLSSATDYLPNSINNGPETKIDNAHRDCFREIVKNRSLRVLTKKNVANYFSMASANLGSWVEGSRGKCVCSDLSACESCCLYAARGEIKKLYMERYPLTQSQALDGAGREMYAYRDDIERQTGVDLDLSQIGDISVCERVGEKPSLVFGDHDKQLNPTVLGGMPEIFHLDDSPTSGQKH